MSSPSPRPARSPTVFTPAAASRCSAFGPTPGSARTGNGARKRASLPGGTTVIPPGFRRSEATLQTTFEVETPSEHESDVAARTDVCTASATGRAPRNAGHDRAEVEVALVDPDLLDPWHDLPDRVPHSLRVLPVESMSWTDEDDVGAPPQRLRGAHRRADAELAGDVVGRRDDPAPLRVPADDERLSCAVRDPRAPRRRRRTHRDRDGQESAFPESYGSAVITALPPPPAIEQPAPNQLSFGVVSGTAAAGTKRVIVRVGSRIVADKPLRQRHFQLRIALPTGESTVQVVTVSRAGRRSSATVPHVFGASADPAAPARSRATTRCSHARSASSRSRSGERAPIYVENLATGAGASWNARATFPAASSLKLAIAVTALARTEGTPAAGSTLDRLLRQMLTYSDNAAANATERYFGGSTSGGSALVNSHDAIDRARRYRDVRRLHARLVRRPAASSGRPDPAPRRQPAVVGLRQEDERLRPCRPAARRLACRRRERARCARRSRGSAPSDARYLLYLLAHVRDPGKLDREVGRIPGVRVLHKAGWINDARHDNGIVLWRGGAYVVSVMTYRSAGVGVSSDVLAGRVACRGPPPLSRLTARARGQTWCRSASRPAG